MYGIQTRKERERNQAPFENDVKMYGIQTGIQGRRKSALFENDVKMYGIQTCQISVNCCMSLRMM